MRRTAIYSLVLALIATSAPAMAQVCTTVGPTSNVGVMPLKPNPRLFAAGNFHTKMPGGGSAQRMKERDLVYVSTQELTAGAHKQVLTVVTTLGNGCFSAPVLSSAALGEDPSLIAVGQFNNDAEDDIAIVDTHVDSLNPAPVLRIFLGNGKGAFSEGAGVSTFVLEAGEIPVSIAAGRFRGQGPDKPLDIAIASIPKDPALPSVVRVLVNNGQGEFSKAPDLTPRFLGDFKPAEMLADNRFREGNRYDLVLSEAPPATPSPRRRILFLRNSGNGNFPDVLALGGAGNASSFLLGVLSTIDTGGGKVDIVTFDDDMRLKIFENDGNARFTLNSSDDINPHVGKFRFDTVRRFLNLAPNGPVLVLTAVATSVIDNKQGRLTLTADNHGKFAPADFRALAQPVPSIPQGTNPTQQGIFGPDPRPHGAVPSIDASLGLVAPLRANGQLALAVVARQLKIEVREGTCSSPTIAPNSLTQTPVTAGFPRCRQPIPSCGDQELVICAYPFSDGTCTCRCQFASACRNPIHCGTNASGEDITPQCNGAVGPDGKCNCGCSFAGAVCAPPRTCDTGSPFCIHTPSMGKCPCRCPSDSDACQFKTVFPALTDPPLLVVY